MGSPLKKDQDRIGEGRSGRSIIGSLIQEIVSALIGLKMYSEHTRREKLTRYLGVTYCRIAAPPDWAPQGTRGGFEAIGAPLTSFETMMSSWPGRRRRLLRPFSLTSCLAVNLYFFAMRASSSPFLTV